jgi:hypothetical protein
MSCTYIIMPFCDRMLLQCLRLKPVNDSMMKVWRLLVGIIHTLHFFQILHFKTWIPKAICRTGLLKQLQPPWLVLYCLRTAPPAEHQHLNIGMSGIFCITLCNFLALLISHSFEFHAVFTCL